MSRVVRRIDRVGPIDSDDPIEYGAGVEVVPFVPAEKIAELPTETQHLLQSILLTDPAEAQYPYGG